MKKVLLSILVVLSICTSCTVESVVNTPIETPVATPSATVEPTPTPEMAREALVVPEGMDGVFDNWTKEVEQDIESYSNTDGFIEQSSNFYGITVNGKRNGNVLNYRKTSMWKSDGKGVERGDVTHTITVTSDGKPLTYSFVGDWSEYNCLGYFQCVDLDGDGTDEIILNLDWRGTRGEIDTHVFTVKDSEIKEILTVLNDGSKRDQFKDPMVYVQDPAFGVRAFVKEQGFCLRTMILQSSGEYILREFIYDGEMQVSEKLININDPKYIKELLNDDPRIPKGERVKAYFWPLEKYANLDDVGDMDDGVIVYSLRDDTQEVSVIKAKTNQNPENPILKTYWLSKGKGFSLSIVYAKDLTGDGLSELFISGIHYEDGIGHYEDHVLQMSGHGWKDVLTLVGSDAHATKLHDDQILLIGEDLRQFQFEWRDGKYEVLFHNINDSAKEKIVVGWDGNQWAVLQGERK